MASKREKLPRWNLNDLIDTSQPYAIERRISKLKRTIREVSKWNGKLSKSISVERFKRLIRTIGKLDLEYDLLWAFADMKLRTNTTSQEALTLKNRIDEIGNEIYVKGLFFNNWVEDLDRKNTRRLSNSVKEIIHWFKLAKASKRHTLPGSEERLIVLKNEIGSQTLVRLYNLMVGELSFEVKIGNKKKITNRNGVSEYFVHPDPNVRRSAYDEFYEKFSGIMPSLFLIYMSIIKDWQQENVVFRKHSSPISAQNFDSDLPDEVIDLVLNSIKKYSEVFQRYFRIKAYQLGSTGKLSRYDLYAPLTRNGFSPNYSYMDAKKIVLDAFSRFSDEFGRIAKNVFEKNHIDAAVYPGKIDGGYCWRAGHEETPWVMINFERNFEGVIDFAHELGHAVHFSLSSKLHPLVSEPSFALMEVVSIFSEIIVSEYLIEKESDPEIKKYLIGSYLDNIYHMAVFQGNFATWEKLASNLIKNQISAEEMSEQYLALLRQNFGNAVDVPDKFKWEWIARDLAYEDPFYSCFYSFGQLLAFALYRMYKQNPQEFKGKFINILSSGKLDSPERTFKNAGINIRSKRLWLSGIKEISEKIDELKKLIKETR